MLRVGEGTVDITPPVGIELAGFHKPLGQERRVEGAREASQVRALVLEVDASRAAIISLDMCSVSGVFSRRVKQRAAGLTGIPPERIFVCATHTHSMPAFSFLRQWGAISEPYLLETVEHTVSAVQQAVEDLAEADCYLGRNRVVGGNFNRTVPQWKTDQAWNEDATHDDRWLDTELLALYFQREQRPLLWYHFSAHPVCYGDGLSGPDWPGIVAKQLETLDRLRPAYLQGHIGDVNPGDGTPWVGDAEETAAAVGPALHHASRHSEPVPVDSLQVLTAMAEVPLDLERLRQELAFYEAHPEQCASGVWVDAPFAKAWYEDLRQWDPARTPVQAPIAALRLGPLALLFHPAELYSFYGLQLRKQSPFAATMVVGYCDDFLGYLTDPQAYIREEYAALVVPKITGLPPFTPDAAEVFTRQCAQLLQDLASA
jgi:neutral ceramidase